MEPVTLTTPKPPKHKRSKRRKRDEPSMPFGSVVKLSARVLHGPKRWSRLPIVHLRVDLGAPKRRRRVAGHPARRRRRSSRRPPQRAAGRQGGEAARLLMEAASRTEDGRPSRAGTPTFAADEADAAYVALCASQAGDLLVLCVANAPRVLARLTTCPVGASS